MSVSSVVQEAVRGPSDGLLKRRAARGCRSGQSQKKTAIVELPVEVEHAGKLHDRASYRYYWELLERAHVTGMTVPGEATSRFFG